MAHHFCALPQELQIEILSNLDAISIICCAMTCTTIYAAFKRSILLAYTIQLHLDGLKDAGTSLSYSVLIESLLRRRQAWLALKVNEPVTHPTMQPASNVYELAGGAFAHMSRDCFEISWLPTARNTNGRALQRSSIGISVAKFTMDPTQDLVVFLEDDGTPPSFTNTRIIRIHIHTISTNTIHPQAQQSPLQFTVVPQCNDTNTVNYAVLQIVHNVVSIHFRNVEATKTRALVWDWTTSDLILDTSASFDPCLPSLEYDFVLLDSTHFFLAMEGISGMIRLYKLLRSHTTATQATHLATLHLPPMSPGVTIHKIFSHAGPIDANPVTHTLFAAHDDDRLHMLTVQYYRPGTPHGMRVHWAHLFLHQRVLYKYARRASSAHAPLDIPWAEWGPPDTRMTLSFPRPEPSPWRRYIYGQRAVFKQYKMGTRRTAEYSSTVNVLDFSLAAVLSAQGHLGSPSSSSGGPCGNLLPSSAIRTADAPLFLDIVETHLPCVISALRLPQSHASCMIYADGIIGVKTDSDGRLLLSIYPI